MRGSLKLIIVASVLLIGFLLVKWRTEDPPVRDVDESPRVVSRRFRPRQSFDSSGAEFIYALVPPWQPADSLDKIADHWSRATRPILGDEASAPGVAGSDAMQRVDTLMREALALNYEGRPREALTRLAEARDIANEDEQIGNDFLYTLIFYQGVTALRCGENDNCIACRGESSCILPLHASAVHTNQQCSRLAVGFFREYLEQFPDDIGAKWLLNLAHMTLGEHPHGVEERYRLELGRVEPAGQEIAPFRNISAEVGFDRLNQAGGGILDDFDRDGLLDVITTSMDSTQPMWFCRNSGGEAFVDSSAAARLTEQLGGLYCVQTDYNNDGFLDVYIPRGAWKHTPIRPTLLHNNGDGTFTDVTDECALLDPVNSITALWADFDNDGNLDLYVCCEKQPNRLFRSRGNGIFLDIAAEAGAQGEDSPGCMGGTCLDFENDGDLDLFITNLTGTAQLLRNDDGLSFSDVTQTMGIDGPQRGFSCWTWDYDNDGWTDIFATCYDLDIESAVQGVLGLPHGKQISRL